MLNSLAFAKNYCDRHVLLTMNFAPGEEGRFEVALSTSLLNELKHGSQLASLAEALLLSVFRDNSIEPELHRQLVAALPSVRYIRCLQ